MIIPVLLFIFYNVPSTPIDISYLLITIFKAMQKIQHISYILILSLLFSCNPQKEKAKYIVNKWLKQRIILPDSINSKQDSLWRVMLDKKFKLLTIIDTSNCTTCRLRLYDWEKYIKDMDSTNSNIAFLFIVHAKDYNAIDLIKKKNKFTYPIFYDYKNKVGKLNTFPKDPRFQTFLLNPKNEIILIGNPIDNKYLWYLYKQTIIDK